MCTPEVEFTRACCTQAVLDALWKKKDQREGTMWHKSPRSFNTAQKKALEKEKRDLEKEAQKRIAEEKAKEEAQSRRPVV